MNRTAQTRYTILFLFILAALLAVASCSRPQPTPTPATTAEPAQITPTATVEAEPTTAPTPAMQPLDLPPVVIATAPERGQEQPLAAPIVLRFDQPMEPASTGAAFAIEPPADGRVAVQRDELVFTPQEPLARGQSYRVTLAASARSAGGKLLAAPLQLRFNTVGFLQVTSTQPADGNEAAAVDAPIIVVFNRPVTPLTGIDQMSDLPDPLVIEPAASGQGEWLNTSIYAFRPDQPLAGATDYQITVAAGLEDVTGGLLAEDYAFSFRTAGPIVVSQEPSGNQVSPATAITTTFSQPMNRAATEAAFSLRQAGSDEMLPGAFTWSDDGRTLRFEPATPLAYAARYVAWVTTEARSAAGDGPLRDAFSGRFETAPIIRLVRSRPADGDTGTPPEGDMQITFQGVVDEKTLGAPALTIIPEPTSVFSYFSSYENRWFVNWPLLPRTDYTVILSGQIGDIFGNALGEDVTIRFSTDDRRPFANLNVPGEVGTYNAYTDTLIAASYRNVSRLDFDLYSIEETVAEQLLGPNRWERLSNFRPRADTLLREWSVAVGAPANANVLDKITLAEAGGPLPAGMYWLELRAPEINYSSSGPEGGQQPSRHLIVVSPLNLIVKKAADEVLVWATDLASGQPVANLPIRVRGAATTAGQTDADGIFQAAISTDQPWEPLTIFAGAPGENFGAVSSEWQQGLSPWEFNLPTDFAPPSWQSYFYTDRPLYRPGQMVYWKGILRDDDDVHYSVPKPGSQLEVTIFDGQGNQVYQQTHDLNAFGTIHGQLALAEEAGLGFYRLEARLLGLPQDAPYQPFFSTGFQVAEYRKPEFEVALTTDRDEYLQGEAIKATLEVNFFFGGPVSGAQVDWTVFSSDASFSYTGDAKGRWYSFNDFSGWDPRQAAQRFGETLTSGSGKTDNLGRFTFQIAADIGDRPQSQNFSIDVRITDLNNQEVSASTGVLVHKGLVYVGLAPRSYVSQVGELAQVDLLTVDWDSQPVADQAVTVVVNQAQWNTVREQGDDGQFFWVTRVQETPVLTETLTTAANGEAVLTWTPQAGGQYKINASVTDEQGNTTRSSAFTWVSDEPDTYVSWRVDNNDRIELVADQPLYQVGDVAQVLAPHPYQGEVQALLTIERGGVLEARRITLAGNSQTLAIPIEADYVPNVYVSLVIVQGGGVASQELGSFKLGNVQLPVDTRTKELRVTLTPSQERLEPGETVTFTVQVQDSAGNPVQGEFSLALVDKALLSLARAAFGEESSLLETFYRQRGLGVQTASTLVVNLDRLNQQLQEGAKGGGGGDGAAMFFDVRSEFEDTALWEPTLTTDAAGQAVLSVTLPDNLTTWRLDGRGVTVDTEVGQATVEIVTTLPLLVRPVLPRFFVSGDQAEIGAIVNNNTEAERTVRVDLEAMGLGMATRATVRLITVPAGGQIKVTWPVEVLPPAAQDAVGAARVRFTALEAEGAAGEAPLRDAVEMTLPVYRYASPETVGTAGVVALDEERLEVIALPPSIDPTQGALRVQLEPSLAAGALEGLTWLEHFPYECSEQIISKFLPNLVTYRALVQLDIDRPDLEENLSEQIATALQKLIQRQNPDGGWGWWGGERSNVFVSGYVVFGLTEARQAGFFTDDAVIERGTAYLTRQLKAPGQLQGYRLNEQAFLLYVLAEAEKGDVGRTMALYNVRERLDHYGQAYLALALGVLAEQGETTAEPRIDTLLDSLTGSAILSATGAHWEEDAADWWTMNTDTRSTSLALAALARLDPENALAPNVVRWLMTARQNGRWETTQENAWAIIALTDWMAATGELAADYSYRVSLNGAELASGAVDRSNVDQPIDLRVEVRNLLLDAANGLALSRFAADGQSGAGQLYYTAHLSYYLPAAELPARDRGVVVARQYTLVDDPATPITQAQVGDTIQVKLTLVAPHDLHYLVLESPLPAGAEAIDPSLATTSQVYEGPEVERQGQEQPPWFWHWTPTYSELRDEKVVLFATELAAGTYEYTYPMRASLPGQFQTLPATAYEMYFPEVWGRSAGELFQISGE